MANFLEEVEQTIQHFAFNIPEKDINKYHKELINAEQCFPASAQTAVIIKLLHQFDHSKGENIIATSEICQLKNQTCVTTFGILSPDWPGLSNACLGVIHAMGWNIHFVKGTSLIHRKNNVGIVIIGVRTEKQEEYDQLISQTETILTRLVEAARNIGGKANLLFEEIRKLLIYSQVISQIEKHYVEKDLEDIIGSDGEAVKYFNARSRDYIENRKIEDIANQIIRNFIFCKTVHETNTIQLDISNFTTRKEGTFTGITVAGPAFMLNLEDCLKTIEFTIPNFRLKHNREFTTKESISIYRIEFVSPAGKPMSDLENKRLQQAFSIMVLNKRRNRAQWIESIGGFEQYARAIIPLLVKEAQNTKTPQIYQSVSHSTDLFIDFKIIAVIPTTQRMKKNLVTNIVNRIEIVPGLHILAVKPMKQFGSTCLFILDIRASLTVIDNVETIYQIIHEKVSETLGDFRDFDEGIRTIDAEKLKSVRRIITEIDKSLIRELYYSIEDFLRINANTDEIIAHIRIAYDMIRGLEKEEKSELIMNRQVGIRSSADKFLPRATLLCVAYSHEQALLQKILKILEPFEVTLSRLERTGKDILICRLTQRDKALSEEQILKLSNRIKKLISGKHK